jgi:exodeoxyribonuclease VII large subunit
VTSPTTEPGPGGLFDDEVGRPATLTVGELAARIARVAAQAFPTDLWVSGQIRNLKRSANGHVYFDLTEPCAMGATPRSLVAVTLLAPERALVNNQLKRAGGAVRMEDGLEIRIQARLRWYEPRGVLQLRMSAIDPEFTLGRLKADRDRVLAALQAEGLLDANGAHRLPAVPLRVALITSTGTAAHADVTAELAGSGLAFSVWLLDVRTQGADAAAQVVAALSRVSDAVRAASRAVDAVLLVRGGGATTDLAVFDDEALARAIAATPVPVLTGIGHEIDRSVADEVAHTALKTPTAAAGALVHQVRAYLARLDQAWDATRRAALATTGDAEHRLGLRTGRIARGVERTLRAHEVRLDGAEARVSRGAGRALHRAERDLQGLAARARAHDPALALARGWTITTGPDGRAVRSVTALAVGDRLVTRFADGHATSTVDVHGLHTTLPPPPTSPPSSPPPSSPPPSSPPPSSPPPSSPPGASP